MKYVLTLIAAGIEDFPVEIASGCVSALELAGAVLAKPQWLGPAACDLLYEGIDPAAAEGMARTVIADMRIDVIAQETAIRRKKLLVADMESTIIAEEMLDELAALKGLRETVAAVTTRAMNGELDFEAALKERVALLAGTPVSALHDAWERTHLNPGAKMLVATMRRQGGRAILVSGGFTVFTAKLAEALKFDDHHGNELEIANGLLTGHLVAPIRGRDYKALILETEKLAMGCETIDCIAVGDGANDIPMLQAAGLGIAYHAKPAVRAACTYRIDFADLGALLYAQGYRRENFSSP